MKISSDGLSFVKQWEAFIAFVYDDLAPGREWDGSPPKGTLTIGYGHTNAAKNKIKMVQGTRVSESQASIILLDDLGPAEDAVNTAVKVPLTQHQFDALVSFKFNTGRLAGTGLLAKVNAKAFADVPGEFMKWINAKGKPVTGLKNRRQGEVALWSKP